MSNSVMSDMFEKIAHQKKLSMREAIKKAFLIFDVDFTLLNTMCCNTTPEQKSLLARQHAATGGGSAFFSGRSIDAIDLPTGAKYPAAGEQGAEIRLLLNERRISLAAPINSAAIAETARILIGDRVPIVATADEIRDLSSNNPAVLVEQKPHSLAKVHRMTNQVDLVRGIITEVGHQLIAAHDLHHTHKVMTSGSDAVEIVPSGIAPDSEAYALLTDPQLQLIEINGLNKVAALHTFMAIPQYRDRVPVFFGDSGTDGAAINAAAEHYVGCGVWILNSNTEVPPEYADAVKYTIPTYHDTWDHIEAGVVFAEAALNRPEKIISLPVPQVSSALGMATPTVG